MRADDQRAARTPALIHPRRQCRRGGSKGPAAGERFGSAMATRSSLAPRMVISAMNRVTMRGPPMTGCAARTSGAGPPVATNGDRVGSKGLTAGGRFGSARWRRPPACAAYDDQGHEPSLDAGAADDRLCGKDLWRWSTCGDQWRPRGEQGANGRRALRFSAMARLARPALPMAIRAMNRTSRGRRRRPWRRASGNGSGPSVGGRFDQ